MSDDKNTEKFDGFNSCIFCDTKDVKITKTKINSKSISKILHIGSSESYGEEEINCQICSRKYGVFGGTAETFFKNHVIFSDISLRDFPRFFPNTPRHVIIDSIFANHIGIAVMLKNKIQRKEFNIVFELEGKRAYLHCKKDQGDFKVISVNEV